MRRFVCTICQVEFRALKRIVYHLPRCTPGPYTCHLCSNAFTSGKELNYHKKKAHRTEKCYDCKECDKSFTLMSSLRKHCVTSHESKALMDSMVVQNGTSYRCDVCHKKFIKRIFLTNHKIRNHNLDKNFLCQVGPFVLLPPSQKDRIIKPFFY
ncbi:UNVERIFIED_CONTAM: hypothetical protein GTU68_065218 [Idotea baltica]|nr:hypothetical protein [Idotea baltica]